MSEFTAWMQSNWYALGNLLFQFAFLAASVWFAREILRTIRASQEQVGALLKLSITGASTERTLAGASPYWLTPSEIPPVGPLDPPESGPSQWAVARHSLVAWLQTPMNSGDTTPWRRAIRWLQAPAGS
jgi:hypothetical protein